MKKYIIAGIGELLWDILPEAELLGGAPVNFTYHANALGAIGIAISTIGQDERGSKALLQLKQRGLDIEAISVSRDFATGYVNAAIDDEGVASYHFPDNVAWDHLQINDYAKNLQYQLDAICFGSLALRSEHSRQAILGYLDTLEECTTRVFDINLRQQFYSREIITSALKRTDIFKLNDEELEILAGMLELRGTVEDQLAILVDSYRLGMIILTRGAHGSILMSPDGSSEHPGIPTRVVDTIGAGDSFTAMATIGYLKGFSLGDINHLANSRAAFVCSRQGAMVTDILPPM